MKEEEREKKLKERKDTETRKSREKRRERKEDSRQLTDDVSSSRGNKETRTFSVKRSLETVYHTDRIRVSTNTRSNYFEHSEIFHQNMCRRCRWKGNERNGFTLALSKT